MLVSDAILDLRNKTNDKDEIGLDDNELLAYLNEAIQYVSAYLISANSPIMVRSMVVNESPFALPDGFVRVVGVQPIRITGNNAELIDDAPMTIRYYASNDLVRIVDDMPFDHVALNQIVVKLAGIYVQNQHSLNIQQDKVLLDEINNAIAAAISGVK